MTGGQAVAIFAISFFIAWPIYVFIDWWWAENRIVIGVLFFCAITGLLATTILFGFGRGIAYTVTALAGTVLAIFVASEINRTVGRS